MFLVQIAGNLGSDPEIKTLQSGQKLISFSVAVKMRQETIQWVKVVSWGDRHEKMISFLKKGSGVIVCGRMNPPTIYDSKNGKQISIEITAEMIEFNPFGKSEKKEESVSVGINVPKEDYHQEELPF